MHSHVRRSCAALVAIALFPGLAGCARVTPATGPDGSRPAAKSSMFPLRFSVHRFASYCYDTLRCRVIYDRFDFSGRYADERSPPPPPGDYRKKWMYAGYAPWLTFPPPVDVKWTSLDGVAHEAKVDLDKIFKKRLALYAVADSEIPDESWSRDVQIYLEVIDRTLNVYMRSIVSTKSEQIPGNRYSHHRNDVILAWTRAY